jgi:hypothetical protein
VRALDEGDDRLLLDRDVDAVAKSLMPLPSS